MLFGNTQSDLWVSYIKTLKYEAKWHPQFILIVSKKIVWKNDLKFLVLHS